MRVVVKKIACPSRSDKIQIVLLGDFHVGNIGCDEAAIRRHVEYIKKSPNTYWVDMGDKCEFITASDKRWDSGNVAEWMTVKGINDLPYLQAKRYVSLVKSIRHKCLGLIEGNHEFTIYKHYHQNIHERVCVELGVPNLGFLSILKLGITRQQRDMVNINFGLTHGAGGSRYIGGKLNRLIAFGNDFEGVSVFAMGHMHDKISYKKKKLYVTKTNQLGEKTIIFCAVPSFFKTYNEGSTSYGERALYSPTSIGATKITIKPFIDAYVKGSGKARRHYNKPPDIHVSE